MSNKTDLSRRQFIGVAGGVIGASMLASSVFAGTPVENMPKIDAETFTQESHDTDVLVIGGGMAGLFATVKAHDAGASVMMVSKGRLGSSGLTPFAKGIFSYDKANASVSIDEFVAKVSESSLGTSNPVFTRQVAEHSYARVQELKSWGFFDSPLCNKSFMRPMESRNVPLQERIMITHLMKEDGRVVGAAGFSMDENKVIFYNAKTVVLCTGSGGFKPNGFPMCDLTHDGTIMAYDIGAVVTGKEWNDGHPGSAENSGSCYDNWHGQVEEKPGLTGVQVNHHLGVDMNYQAYTQGAPIKMGPPGPGNGASDDASSVTTTFPKGPFTPEAFRQTDMPPRPPEESGLLSLFAKKRHEGPPGMGGEQVGGSTAGMAIHKAEGLVPIDETGLSTIPGLYAAGDALGSYMSGGIYTQIGGSLAGSAVQGAFAGEAAAKASFDVVSYQAPKARQAQIKQEILAPLKRKSGYSPAWVTQVLQGVMIPNFVLYVKKARMMQGALAYVEELKEHHAEMLMAQDRHQLRLAHETKNMIITAEMKLKASMMRTESRCSHYRLDYPDIDNENWQAWLNIRKGDKGEMVFEKQPFDKWPALS
ncbi:fumarate reductase [Vibrio sp. 10N.286.49.C2]|uniref:FAD-dependent oxidoreductase n=1 Tax=unclassified Vibrio TaxID=2614977 RepID=UPI000C81F2BA|nr:MULTISPECIES: FAD-binding protein [unclassified Vibrio]PMH33859.1 fumarate reductase [Vibrio sp. 10N.286.49.C2]PMH44117.1 fumarate reductase [Vibrio sp. 10N.286.49.B1]PMH80934.1 fumarate reductase [Vibrio sp. 10N.286.48.B7]